MGNSGLWAGYHLLGTGDARSMLQHRLARCTERHAPCKAWDKHSQAGVAALPGMRGVLCIAGVLHSTGVTDCKSGPVIRRGCKCHCL